MKLILMILLTILISSCGPGYNYKSPEGDYSYFTYLGNVLFECQERRSPYDILLNCTNLNGDYIPAIEGNPVFFRKEK